MNEKKYIDGALLEKELRRRAKGFCTLCQNYNYCIEDSLDRRGSHKNCWQPFELPAADVAEVKHGEWNMSNGDYLCSACNQYSDRCYYDYCPNCGAKMDKI